MKTLVLVEHDGSTVKDPTLPAVTAASQIGDVHLLVIGSNVGAVAEATATTRPFRAIPRPRRAAG